MRLLPWLGILSSARGVQGESLAKDELCVTAIFSAYNYIPFQGHPTKGMWDIRCRNPLKVTSIYASSGIYCHDGERVVGLAALAKLCREVGHSELLPRDAVAGNLTEEAVRNMRVVDYQELSRTDFQGTPVLLSSTYFHRMFNTIDSWQFETWSHHAFSYIGYAYWAVILFLGILCRLCSWVSRSQQRQYASGREFNTYQPVTWHQLPLPGNAIHWVQTHLIIPAPLAGRGRQIFCCKFTTRAEALVVAGFWILSMILSVVGYRTFPGNIYWPDVTSQILRYSADRTGILSFANFPLLFLFGGRNNILIWATGWRFATFSVFHRHVARIATLQAVAHSVLYLVIYIGTTNKIWKEVSKAYILWGILAFVLMILVLITSLDRMRTTSYEIFMVAHIVFSAVTLGGCFYHTIVFEGHEYWKYLWPSVIAWAIDRCLRAARLVYYNVHVRLSKRNLINVTESRMTYDEAADVIRLEITPGISGLQVRPGDYYFLYQPIRFTGWESHPFTVGAWSYDVDPLGAPLDNYGKPWNSLDNAQLPLLSESFPDQESWDVRKAQFQRSSTPRLIFWIRPYDGWTRQLRRQCLRAPNQPVHTTILLEGPYGQSHPLWRYESLLMIVGGTGIAAAVPYLQDHLQRSANHCSSTSEGKSRTRDIELVWTTRQPAFLRELADRELNPMLSRDDFRASFYATGSSDRFRQDFNALGYTVQMGRPDLQSLILTRASEASAAGMKLAILVCGPAGMADEARAATHLATKQGYQDIKYVEESFTW